MIRKLLLITLCVFLCLPFSVRAAFIYADDEEKSDYDKCIEDKDRDACRVVYKEIKGEESKALKEIENQIKESEGQMEKVSALVAEYSQKAQALQGDIDALKVQIDELIERIEVDSYDHVTITLRYRSEYHALVRLLSDSGEVTGK